jgi:hypothetical protein
MRGWANRLCLLSRFPGNQLPPPPIFGILPGACCCAGCTLSHDRPSIGPDKVGPHHQPAGRLPSLRFTLLAIEYVRMEYGVLRGQTADQ